MSLDLSIEISGSDSVITPGCKIRIGRFNTKVWTVHYGWYAFSGNREICGWYLTNDENVEEIRPLQRIDLTDIYFIEQR